MYSFGRGKKWNPQGRAHAGVSVGHVKISNRVLKLDDDYSGEKLPEENKTNGRGEASWLGEEDETNWPNDVAGMTYKDALVKSEV